MIHGPQLPIHHVPHLVQQPHFPAVQQMYLQVAVGMDFNGPHDSQFANGVIATLNGSISATDTTYGATPINGSTTSFPASGTSFTFVTTQAAPTSEYPTSGGTFIVPITAVALHDTWATVTYTSCSTSGSTTTFSGCTANVSSNRSVTASGGLIGSPSMGFSNNRGSGTHGSTGPQLHQIHVWGRNHIGCWSYGTSAYCSNCEFEGAFIANIILTGGSTVVGGAIYGTNGQAGQANEIGIQIGTPGDGCDHAQVIGTSVYNVGGSSSTNGGSVVVSSSSGGNMIKISGRTNAPAYVYPYLGSADSYECICQSNFALSVLIYNSGAAGQFLDGVIPGGQGTTATIYSGSGTPNIINAAAGSFYFRTDTPGVSGQQLYIATAANTWTGIL
jgi:hypothetical protein